MAWCVLTPDETETGSGSHLAVGSTLHALKALSYPRWEDYNYELADPVQNRAYWLGDGQTYSEKTLTGDRTSNLLRTGLIELIRFF